MVQRLRAFKKRRKKAFGDWIRRTRFTLLDLFHGYPLLSFIILIGMVVAPTSVVLGLFEKGGDSAIWRTLVYILSGLDVDQPQTAEGQIAAILILLSGVIFVSLLTGYVAASFTHLLLTARAIPGKPESRTLEGHVIIVGWGAKTKAVLRELNADRVARGVVGEDIVILSDDATIERGPEPIYKSVMHIRGKPTDPDVLRRADLTPHAGRGARVVALLSDTKVSPEEADRQTLLSVLAVEHLFPDVVSIAEVSHSSEEQHFRNANVDEVTLVSEITDALLARSCVYPGVADYFDELLALAPSEGAGASKHQPCSFYLETPKNLKIEGKILVDVTADLYERTGVLAVGIVRGDRVALTVEGHSLVTQAIRPGDLVLLIAYPEALERL